MKGTNKAMNWLKELVEGSQSSLDVLPVSCLCEFLIMGYQERTSGSDTQLSEEAGSSHRTQFKRKHRGKDKVCCATCGCTWYLFLLHLSFCFLHQLLQQQELIMSRLQSLIKGSSSAASLNVLSYFLAKLSSSQLMMRQLSLKV